MVFVPPAGATPAERWVAAGRSAAAADLVRRLNAAGFAPTYSLTAEADDRERLEAVGARPLPTAAAPFHFGRALTRVAADLGPGALAYFGAACGPLAGEETLRRWLDRSRALPHPGALVNNLFSTDWIILNDASVLDSIADQIPTDNSLGWVLSETGRVRVEAVAPSAESRADIDTPGDLALIRHHPGLGPDLRRALADFPPELGRRADAAAAALRVPATSVALIGRVSEVAWSEAVRRTQVWIRVFAEERGMRASQRLARGEVRSLIGGVVDRDGPEDFLGHLGELAQACLWDTRVWMAQRGGWPPPGDRMAADLGWVDQVEDRRLRELARAIDAAPLAVVTGGHGVVSGSLLGWLDVVAPEPRGDGEDYQPSR